MVLLLTVEVDQLEEDADIDLVRERVQDALDIAFPYHDVSVTADEG